MGCLCSKDAGSTEAREPLIWGLDSCRRNGCARGGYCFEHAARAPIALYQQLLAEFFSIHNIESDVNIVHLVDRFILKGGDLDADGNGLDQLQAWLAANFGGATLRVSQERTFSSSTSLRGKGKRGSKQTMGTFAETRLPRRGSGSDAHFVPHAATYARAGGSGIATADIAEARPVNSYDDDDDSTTILPAELQKLDDAAARKAATSARIAQLAALATQGMISTTAFNKKAADLVAAAAKASGAGKSAAPPPPPPTSPPPAAAASSAAAAELEPATLVPSDTIAPSGNGPKGHQRALSNTSSAIKRLAAQRDAGVISQEEFMVAMDAELSKKAEGGGGSGGGGGGGSKSSTSSSSDDSSADSTEEKASDPQSWPAVVKNAGVTGDEIKQHILKPVKRQRPSTKMEGVRGIAAARVRLGRATARLEAIEREAERTGTNPDFDTLHEAEAEVAAATRIVAALGGNTGEQPALPSSASSSGDRKRRLTPQNTRAYQAKLKEFYARQGKDMTMPDIAGIVDYYIVRDGHPKKPGSGLQQLRTRLFSEYGCTIGVIRTADEEAALAAKV